MRRLIAAAFLAASFVPSPLYAQDKVPALIEKWKQKNDLCRGPDSPEASKACEDRGDFSIRLARLGFCFGREDEAGYQYDWHRCEANSLRPATAGSERRAAERKVADSLVQSWVSANEQCKLTPETERTKAACEERRSATAKLLTAGYCNTPQPGSSPAAPWYRCNESTLPAPLHDEGRVEGPPEPPRTTEIRQADGQAFELRGIRLGATLDAVRSMRHPDGQASRLFCSGDPEVENTFGFAELKAHVVDRTAAAGTRHCMYYTASGSDLREDGFKVATVGSYVTLDFVPGNGGRPLLYKITVRTNVSGWPLFWEGYNGKYGRPAKFSDAPTGNRAGGVFDNVTAVWENGSSRITAIKRHQRIDNTFVFYEHKALTASVEQRLRAKSGKPANGL